MHAMWFTHPFLRMPSSSILSAFPQNFLLERQARRGEAKQGDMTWVSRAGALAVEFDR